MKYLLAVLVYFGLAGYAGASTPMTEQQGEANQLQALQDDYNQRQSQATSDYIKQHDQEHPDRQEEPVSSPRDDEDGVTRVVDTGVLVSNETKN